MSWLCRAELTQGIKPNRYLAMLEAGTDIEVA